MQSFSFYHVFSSHMVLQRERPIVFSGKGEPGKKFSVTFADKTKKGTVDEDGEWSITFPFMNAGGPYSLSAGYDGAKPSVQTRPSPCATAIGSREPSIPLKNTDGDGSISIVE